MRQKFFDFFLRYGLPSAAVCHRCLLSVQGPEVVVGGKGYFTK